MGNSTVRNPVLIDTWSADVVVSATAICVKKIRLLSAAAGDLMTTRLRYVYQLLYTYDKTPIE